MSEQQQELPGMPEETALGQAAKRFVGVKEDIAAAKLRIADLEKEILEQMKAESVPHFKVSVAGENYEFELVNSEESVRCAKITKTVKKDVRQDVGAGVESKEAVGAV